MAMANGVAGQSLGAGSRRSGGSAGSSTGLCVSSKQAAVAISEDQKATHSRAGMIISPRRIGRYEHSGINVPASSQFRKLVRDKNA
jgi:hypothetical protein